MSIEWNAEVEARFQRKLREDSAKAYRPIFAVAIPFFAAFALIDWLMIAHEAFVPITTVRAAGIAVMIYGWIRAGRPHPPRWIELLLVLNLGICIVVMGLLSGGYRSPYFFGMSLLVLAIANIFPWNTRRVAAWVYGCALTYVAAILVHADFAPEDPKEMTNAITFLVACANIATWGAWIANKLRREAFLHLLEAQSEQLQNARITEALGVRDEFISIASHELRTPITAMKLLAWTTRKAVERGDQTILSRSLDGYDKQLRRLLRLVDDMLDLSRISHGRLPLVREPTDLSSVTQDVLETFRVPLEQAGIALVASVDPGVEGDWDRQRLEQIVSNLVGNAIKYAPGTPLEVKLSRLTAHALLEVRDHGPGVHPEDVDLIFERYNRGRAELSAAGLGLGLYIAREIVEAHGGSIRAALAGGGGLKFSILLPYEAPAAETAAVAEHRLTQ